MADQVIPMSLTCGDCGQSIFNDKVDIRHPIDFIKACEDRGWKCTVHPAPETPQCPDCIAKGKP